MRLEIVAIIPDTLSSAAFREGLRKFSFAHDDAEGTYPLSLEAHGTMVERNMRSFGADKGANEVAAARARLACGTH